MIRLILDDDLDRGKCYTVSGSMVYDDDSVGGSVAIYIGNETTKTLVGVQGFDEAFEFDFNYTTASTFFQSLYLDYSGAYLTDLALKLDESCATEYCSECFQLEECTYPPSQELVYLEWWNDDDGFGFDYTSLFLKHTVWLKGGLRDDDYSYDEEYFTTSDGRNFPVYVDATKSQALYINEVPAYIHDAIRLGVVHDNFMINGERYSKGEGGYSPDWNTPNSLLAGVIVRVREQTQNTKNYHC